MVYLWPEICSQSNEICEVGEIPSLENRYDIPACKTPINNKHHARFELTNFTESYKCKITERSRNEYVINISELFKITPQIFSCHRLRDSTNKDLVASSWFFLL